MKLLNLINFLSNFRLLIHLELCIEIKPKINELIKHCTLGDYNVWNVITIVLNENGPNYKEIIRRSLKNRELEFRLKIDYDEFIKSDYEHKKKLVIELLLRSLDLMEKWKEIKKEEREKIKLIIEEEFKEILEWKKTGKAPEDYYSGGNFLNREGLLPTTDKNGNDITYIEYDVNPFTTKKERGLERLVIGSDGSAWKTTDHYKSFERIE